MREAMKYRFPTDRPSLVELSFELDESNIDEQINNYIMGVSRLHPHNEIEKKIVGNTVTIRAVRKEEPIEALQYAIRNSIPLHLESVGVEQGVLEIEFIELEGLKFTLTERIKNFWRDDT